MDNIKIIRPRIRPKYRLVWKPEPFLAEITDEGIVEHQNPELPGTKILVTTQIPKHQFDMHAEYTPGYEYYGAAWEIMKYTSTADPIFLMADGGDTNIYCLSAPMGVAIVFGKLLESNKIHKKCVKSFLKFFSR